MPHGGSGDEPIEACDRAVEETEAAQLELEPRHRGRVGGGLQRRRLRSVLHRGSGRLGGRRGRRRLCRRGRAPRGRGNVDGQVVDVEPAEMRERRHPTGPVRHHRDHLGRRRLGLIEVRPDRAGRARSRERMAASATGAVPDAGPVTCHSVPAGHKGDHGRQHEHADHRRAFPGRLRIPA